MNSPRRYLAKLMMFISSYFPLYIMLMILNFDKCIELKISLNIKVVFFVAVMVTCIIISFVSLLLLTLSTATKKIKIEEIERPDDTIISYMMTYIIPILTTNMTDNQAVAVNAILFLLIGYLYIRLNLLYLNPLWSMFGFLAYRANSEVIIVTNIKFSEIKQLKNIPLNGFYLANNIFVVKQKDNEFE